MTTKRRVLSVTFLILFAVLVHILYQPLNWNSRLINLTRSEVHQKIGAPAEDMFALKGLEVYERRMVIGRWLYLVGYDDSALSSDSKQREPAQVAGVQKVLHLGGREQYFPIAFHVVRSPTVRSAEPPPRASDSNAPGFQTLDSLPAPASGGGR
jgi:hypothetical protein